MSSSTLTDGAVGEKGQPNWIVSHCLPLIGIVAILIGGMAFSFLWNPLLHHASIWYTPPDLWRTFRAAQYVSWASEGVIYNSHTYFDSFPGIAVLLAPIAKLSAVLHMSESFPMALPQPTTWYILGPANFILGGLVLFPLDAISKMLAVSFRRRIVLTVLECAVIWPAAAIWGHPEDGLALAFALYGLMSAFSSRWTWVAFSFALAVVFQPLTLLVLPIAMAYAPLRKWPLLASAIALPSALLLVPPLVKEWGPTTRILLNQPNYPDANHPTPWIWLAPILNPGHLATVHIPRLVTEASGKKVVVEATLRVHIASVVAAGPGRLVAVVLACAIGLWVAKRKPPLVQVIWLSALALSLRSIFECVMDPYYLLPGLALVLVVASTRTNARLVITVLFVAASTWISYWYISPWHYYIEVIGALIVALALAAPIDFRDHKLRVRVPA